MRFSPLVRMTRSGSGMPPCEQERLQHMLVDRVGMQLAALDGFGKAASAAA